MNSLAPVQCPFATFVRGSDSISSEALVFVHGVGLDQRIWDDVRMALNGAHTALFYDLPGHGKRAQDLSAADLNSYVDDLAAMLDRFAIDRAVIVGAAFGEFIARRMAVRHPQRVAALILLSPLWRRTPSSAEAVLRRVAETDANGAVSSLAASMERWLSPATRASFPDRERRVQDMVQSTPHNGFMSAYRLYATSDALLADEAGSIKCPVLLISGGDDPNATPAMAQRLADAMGNAEIAVLPGVRHLISIDAPEALSKVLAGFLKRLVHQ